MRIGNLKISSALTLLRHVTLKSIEKGALLIKEGSTKKDVFFIRKGLVRCYYVNEKADEITFQLFPEYNLVLNIQSILFSEPSKFSYQALESTKVYTINYDTFIELTSKNSNLMEINRTFIGRRTMKKVYQRIESFVLLSPEERYKKYVEDYPNIVNRAPDKYIANVLGITPVSLSRMRKRMSTKKN